MAHPTYEPAQRPDGSWGVRISTGDQIFGSYDTQALAQAAAEGATWAVERMGAGR